MIRNGLCRLFPCATGINPNIAIEQLQNKHSLSMLLLRSNKRVMWEELSQSVE